MFEKIDFILLGLKRNITLLLLVLVLTIITLSCRKLEIEKEVKITSHGIVDIHGRSAKAKASIIDVGHKTFHFGHCWDTLQNPTILNNHTDLGITDKAINFESQIIGLVPFTQYFVKPYMTDGNLIIYGDELSFTTTGDLPSVELIEINSITSNSFFYKGIVTLSGNSAVIERGICIRIAQNPVKDEVFFINGNDTGKFEAKISNLERATYYLIRAYAINLGGISFSNEIKFKTLPELPIIETKEITNITNKSATSGGIVIDNGGEEISEYGICWSTLPSPTVNNSKITINYLNSEYSLSLSSLTPLMAYYLRAFATNRNGTAYGQEVIFSTTYDYDTTTIIDARDGESYKVVKIGEQWWMAENLRTKKYLNGDEIETTESISSDISNQQNPKYQWASLGKENFIQSYGRVYTWHTIIDSRKVCPTGWHVPSFPEWEILVNVVGGKHIAGYELKEADTTHWKSPNNGTNNSGFTALPSGYRMPWGTYPSDGTNTWFWSITPNFDGDIYAKMLFIELNDSNCGYSTSHINSGLAVRCVKD